MDSNQTTQTPGAKMVSRIEKIIEKLEEFDGEMISDLQDSVHHNSDSIAQLSLEVAKFCVDRKIGSAMDDYLHLTNELCRLCYFSPWEAI